MGPAPPKSGLFVEIVPEKRDFENIKTSLPRISRKNADLDSPGEGLAWSAKYSYTPWEYF